MTQTEEFLAIFEHLKEVLKEQESDLVVTVDDSESYSLDAPRAGAYKKPLFFGAAHIKKRYVSYHLMPVYIFPELLDNLSPGLRKRMQGKSCFNFRTLGDEQLRELRSLTEDCLARFKAEDLA